MELIKAWGVVSMGWPDYGIRCADNDAMMVNGMRLSRGEKASLLGERFRRPS